MNQFGEYIKQLRESNSLLQRQVANLLEMDTPMFSKIERGERNIRALVFRYSIPFGKYFFN
jgi:transcriptional regulator with XRE-family HTH domain